MPEHITYKTLSPEDIGSAYQAELTRLESLGLDNEELELARRYYSDKERKGMNASDFCGPGRSFPVKSQEDVTNAAGLAGHAANPDAVRACIKRKAKANGWTLPDSWTEKASRAMTTDADAFMYVPITRIDKDQWIIEGTATNDSVDHYGTVFDYESSKKAFQTWGGNIREMHDSKKAVGRAVEIIPDDENHRIGLRVRISKGAKDTWEKIVDGTLNGFSIGVPSGKYKVKEVERGGKSVPMYYDHSLAEVSVVDSVGTPGCDDVVIARADGMLTNVVDTSEEEAPPPSTDVNRAGATISHATQDQLHGVRNGLLRQLDAIVDLCMCEECAALCALFDPDDDGDFDIVPSLDYDNDGGGQQDMTQQAMNYNLEAAITRHMAPLMIRMHAMLSQQAQRPQTQPTTISTEPLERRIADVERAVKSDLDIVRSLLSEVKGLAEKIAAQPMPGGPVMTPVDKRLATSPQPGSNPNDDIAAIQRAAQLGLLKDQDSQVAAAAQLFRLQNPGR